MPSPDLFDSQLRQELQTVLTSLSIDAISRSIPRWVPASRSYMYFRPPSHLVRTGCWCADRSRPRVHNWTNCPNTGSRRPPIIDDGAIIQEWGIRNYPTHEQADTFRFVPSNAVYSFLQWEFRRGPSAAHGLTRYEESLVRNWTTEQHRIMSLQRRQPSVESYFNVMCRIVFDLMHPSISQAASQSPYAADIERVHRMLSWQCKSAAEILRILGNRMRSYREGPEDFLAED